MKTRIVLSIFIFASFVLAQATFTNADVITEAAKGVPGVMAKISASDGKGFDVSPVGLAALKQAGVADSVIIAVIQKQGADITNQTLVNLHTLPVGAADLVRLIQITPAAKADFDTTTSGMAQLIGAGVPEAVRTAVVAKKGQAIDPDDDLPVLEALNAPYGGSHLGQRVAHGEQRRG